MTLPPAKAAVLLASSTPDDIEAQFYEALATADVARLMAVWSDDDDIVCVHPAGGRLVGPAAIRAAFTAMFANGAIPVQPVSVRRIETDAAAVHHLLERLDVVTADGPRSAYVLATNVYLKSPQGWRLVAHHASPAGADDRPERSDAGTTLH